MSKRKLLVSIIKNKAAIFILLLPLTAHASFIESTIGTAVVNDATAAYYNPAALVLLKNPQVISQGSIAIFHSKFIGEATLGGITQAGSASAHTNYFSPSLYFGFPTSDRVTLGLAILANSANKNTDEDSIIRYAQAKNSIVDYDLIPAIGVKLSEIFSIGAGVNFSYANFNLHPITGFPGSDIADSQSHNQSDGKGVGGNVGFLLKPGPTTLVGFNYRTVTTYQLSGTSIYNGSPHVVSDNYHLKLWTPARSIFSISHFVTPKLGFITTVQHIQWSILKNINIYGIANQSGGQPIIVNAAVPYYLHNAWLLTLGSQYRILPHWIVRVAGSYNQSPGNGYYQIANGDSVILGVSTGYELTKQVTIDGSYAHAFMKNEHIDITGGRYLVNGVNECSRDAVSLKLTFNIV